MSTYTELIKSIELSRRPQQASLSDVDKLKNEVSNVINEFEAVIHTTSDLLEKAEKENAESTVQKDLEELNSSTEKLVKDKSNDVKNQEKVNKTDKEFLTKVNEKLSKSQLTFDNNKDSIENISLTMKDTFGCLVGKILDVTVSLGKFSLSAIGSAFTMTFSIFNKVYSFFANIKTYWYQFDAFMSNFGPIWSTIKGVVNTAAMPLC